MEIDKTKVVYSREFEMADCYAEEEDIYDPEAYCDARRIKPIGVPYVDEDNRTYCLPADVVYELRCKKA